MKKSQNSFASMLEGMRAKEMEKISSKLPSWAEAARKGLIKIPSSLALEQCSSEAAAIHKAMVASAYASRGCSIADLTGGIGADSWAFSKSFSNVLHNEMNADLSEAVKWNFTQLGITNTEFCSFEISESSLTKGEICNRLTELKPDIIFLDPARRSKTGSKVFLPEDCSPDITKILPHLLEISPVVMIKLSPVMDLTLLSRKIAQIKEIRIIGVEGECKELLCIAQRDWRGGCVIIAEELNTDGTVKCTCSGQNIRQTTSDWSDAPFEHEETIQYASEISPGMTLAVPSATALKAECHGQIAASNGMKKLDRFTHIYTGLISDSTDSLPFFKRYSVIEIKEFSNQSIKGIGNQYPGADVTARNIPVTSEELKAKLYGKTFLSGSGYHIFGVSTVALGRVLIVCTPAD